MVTARARLARSIAVLVGPALVLGLLSPPTAAAPDLQASSPLVTVSTTGTPDDDGGGDEPVDGAIDLTADLPVNPEHFGAPEPEVAEGTSLAPSGVDDEVTAAVDDDGTAPVIVRLTEQADLDHVARRAEAAAATAADQARSRHRGTGADADRAVAEAAQDARAAVVVEDLQATATVGQARVLDVLDDHEAAGRAAAVTPFWIFNGFAATVDAAALADLAEHPDVASITLDHVIEAPEPIEPADTAPLLPTWSLEKVKAPEVWGEYGVRGDGVVVGVMDGGADGGHPALAGSWRGTDGDPATSWFAATGEDYPAPGDGSGHGTHVTGSIVGDAPGELTGVAPGAEWIAAKIFRDSGTSSESIIHSAFQWMLAPGGDPAAAPDVVNNSWGASAPNATTFWDDVEAWVAAGIVPVFANGNDGPAPGTVGSPGSYPHSIGIGATDVNDLVAGFSSRGPVVWDGERYTKPQVSAPGHLIRSTWPRRLDDDGYHTISGTSMASPHATGVVALMLSAAPDLTVEEIRGLLGDTARVEPHMGGVPNDSYGSGIVDAFAAVTRAAHSGILNGTITGPDGPVAATVTVGDASAVADAESGGYELAVREGTHAVTVSAYGLVTETSDVTITIGETTTVDVDLVAAAEHQLSGTVTGADGPLERARVTVVGTPLDAALTGADGGYALTLAAGTYTLRVAAAGHEQRTVDLTVDGDQTVDVSLDPLTQPSDPGWSQYQNNAARSGLSAESLAAESLEPSWTATAGGAVTFANPVIAGGQVLLGSDGGRLTSRDLATGEQQWAFQGADFLRGTPAVADGVVYTGGGNAGGIHAVDAESGAEIWSVPTPDRLAVYTAPSVVDGVVYAATGPTQGREDTVFALDAATGAVIWAADVGTSVFAGPAVGEGLAVVGNADDGELIALDVATGTTRWTLTRDDDYFIGGASIVEGTVYIPTTDGDGGGSLLAVDAATGALRWEADSHGDGQGSTPAVYGDLVIAGSHGAGVVVAYDRDTGDAVWHYAVAGAVSASVMVTDDGYVVGGSQLDYRIWALDAATGELVWDAPAQANVTSSAAYAEGRLVTADARGNIFAFHATGTVRGTVTGPEGPVAATVTIAESGATAATDPATGGYELTHLPGTYTVDIASYGLEGLTQEVRIVAGGVSTIDADLAAVGTGGVAGTVRDDAGAPLAGANVTLVGAPHDAVTTTDDGGFTFDDVAAGDYRLDVERTGYAPSGEPVQVVAGETTTVEIILTRYEIALVGDDDGRMQAVLAALGYSVEPTDYAEVAARPEDFGVVVANGADGTDPGQEAFQSFLEATDAAGTSVVWLDQWSLGWGAINHLVDHTGDPESVPGDLSTSGRVSIVPTVEHPLTAGLALDERTDLLAPRSAWSTFEGYSGTTVAELYTEEHGTTGSVIGYRPRGTESVHVLLGSLAAAASWGAPEEDWQPAAQTVLDNAVSYAMDARFGAVTGTVTDVSGAPLAATVSVPATGESTTTAADGTYTLLLSPGEHTVRYAAAGATPVERTVAVDAGASATVDVTLAGSGHGALRGVVTSGRDGAPVVGAEVVVTGTELTATTDDTGAYTVADVPGGTYALVVGAAGHLTSTTEVVIADGTETVADVELAAAPRVGVIGDRDADGVSALMSGAEFAAEPLDWTDTGRLPDLDVVVFNDPDDPGKEAFLAFLDAMDAAGVSGVFPDDRFSSYGGARLLRDHVGDPAGTTPISGEGVVSYAARAPDHPLFAGLSEQPEVLLHGRYAAAVEGYSGVPLADVVTGSGGNRGVGAAYSVRSPGSIHLILGGLAATLFQGPAADWTDDGRQLYLNAISWAAAPGLGSVEGTIAAADGDPLPATVEIVGGDRGVTTDGDGGYVLPVEPGDHTLRISAFGYRPVEHDVVVEPDGVTRLDVELDVADVGSVAGTVTAGPDVGVGGPSADGAPLAGATVRLLGTPSSTITGEDGSYALDLVEPGEYDVEVVAEGHVRTRVRVAVVTGEQSVADIAVRPSPTVGVVDDYQDRMTSFLRHWGYTPEPLAWTDTARLSDLDLVVANLGSSSGHDPGSEGWTAFHDALTRASIPALWLDQYGRGAFRYLSEYDGDPGVLGEGRNDGPVTVTAADPEHPVLDGLPSSFALVADDEEYSWFDDFGGTTVATVGTDAETDRGLAGVRHRGARAVDVLLGTLSMSSYGYPARDAEAARGWTPEAERLLANAVAYTAEATDLGAEVRGTLTDAAGTPIAGRVTVAETGDVVTVRDGDGSFVVTLDPGTWTLEASSFGLVTAELVVEVAAGDVRTETIALDAQPAGTLAGTVTGPGGAPVEGAHVAVAGTPLTATTAADGGYTIPIVPEGDWTVRVAAAGHQTVEREVTVTADATVTVDVALGASRPVAVVGDSLGSLAELLGDEGYTVESFSSSGYETLTARIAEFDLVIANGTVSSTYRPAFEAALDAAATQAVSVIVAGQWGGGALGALSAVRGDPAEVDYSFVPESIDYVPAVDHPVFAGFPAGEPVTLVANPGGNQQYLSYSGYSGTTIANLRSSTDGEDLGNAVGYRFSSPSSVELLLGGLAAGGYGRPNTRWTDDARRIYLNAVAWAIEAQQAEVVGTVTGGGAPVEGATVTAVEAGVSATTGADGGYTLGLPGGTQTIRAEAFGFATVERVVEVPASGTVAVDVDLVPLPRGSVAGAVTAAGGDPVAGATLTGTGPEPWTTVSDPDGTYASGDLVEGDYDVRVVADGYLPASATVTVEAGAVATLDVTLRPLDVGVLGDADGALTAFLRGAEVAAAPLDWDAEADLDRYEVIVVNGGSPDRATFDAVLAAADAAEVSLVFTGTWGVDQGGVRLLERHTGRVSVSGQGYGAGPVTLTGFDPAHALFAGLADPATLIGDGGYYSVLGTYDGRALAGLSVAQDGAEPITGVAAGYSWRTPGSVEVVLSASAVTGAVGPGRGWTPDGERLLLNAVGWAHGAELTVPAAPALEAAPVTVADTVDVSGTAEWPSDVTVSADGVAVATVETAVDGTWSAKIPVEVGATTLTAVAANAAGESVPSADVVVSRWAPVWAIRGGQATKVVTLALDGAAPDAEPADAATLVVRDADGAEVARHAMRWAGDVYHHVLSRLPAGDYTVSAELSVDGTVITADGPDVSIGR